MRAKILNPGPPKIIAAVFDAGDEVVEGLTRVAGEHGLSASQFTGLGAFERAVLGFFDVEEKDYVRIPVDEQTEVVSLVGDIALHEGEPKLHAHVVLSKRDGTAVGGHLLEAVVRPTLEVIVTEAPSFMRRRHDPETGLPLIDLTAS